VIPTKATVLGRVFVLPVLARFDCLNFRWYFATALPAESSLFGAFSPGKPPGVSLAGS
jgi:hypothetical protein